MCTQLAKRSQLAFSLVISLLCWFGHAPLVWGQTLPSGFNAVKTQDGYIHGPIGLVFSKDGKYQFVWDKAGHLWVSTWNGTQYVKQPTPVINLLNEVGNWADFGLLSVALDPNFDQNGFAYFFYVVDRYQLFNGNRADYDNNRDEYYNATIGRLTRYKLTISGNTVSADYNTRKLLLGENHKTGVPVTHQSHAGGTIVFGRDGSLLLSTGDNASFGSPDKGSAPETYYQAAIADSIMRPNENVGAFRSQMITSLCGKVLRLDPNTGDGISSNPFYDSANPRSAKSRVWTLGMRNPYRMTLQPGTGSTNPADGNPGTLLIGDVGWGTWEDMHVVRRGGENAGWPLFEGISPQPDYMNAAQTLLNRDEPNPNSSCEKPFLTFADLLRDEVNPEAGAAVATSPCGTTPLPGLQRRYFHSRPALDWKHGEALARTPTFNGVTPTATPLGAAGGGGGTPFQGNCSIAGAYYPENPAFPAAWQNTYFFADYGTNWIKAATLSADGKVTEVREFLPASTGVNSIVDVEYNSLDGALYYLNVFAGSVMKISYGGNRPPVAAATTTSLVGTSPLSVTFNAGSSADPDGDSLTYAWSFGDGTSSTLANPVKVFTGVPGKGFTVQLTVTDSKGLSDTKSFQVSLNNAAPSARIARPLADSKYPLDKASTYPLTAAVTDETPETLTYAWQLRLHHNNHEHREAVINEVSPTIVISPVGCDGEDYYYLITLKITDAGGLTAQDSVRIYPDCNTPSLAITNLSAAPLTNAVRLNWTNPAISFDNVLVVGKAGSGFTDRPSDPTYTANSSFTANSAAFFGGKVLYQGVATSLTVTELMAGQPYYFRVYTRRGSAWTGGVEISATPNGSTPPPASVTGVAPNTCYRIYSRVSGRVLGVENGVKDDGAAVRQRTDANQDWQRWKFEPIDNGYYQLVAAHSNKVLDVWWSSQENGAGLHQWTANGTYSQNQHWALQRNAEGYFQITARHSGKALDVQNSNQTEGGMVIQYTPNGTAAQQWLIEERTCTTTGGNSTTAAQPTAILDPAKCYRIQSRSSGKVLNVPAGLPDDGVNIRQNTNTDRPWQKWRFYPIDGGYYRVSVLHNGKSIEVPNYSTADGTLLHQWTFWGGDHQQWRVARNTEGFYTFTNRNSGKRIDVSGANTNEGGDIIQSVATAGTNQQWSITETTCPVGGRIGFADEPLTAAFSLWPNPARDHVLIDLSQVAGQPVGLSVTDLAGRSLQQLRLDSAPPAPFRLHTGQLANGLYLINIEPDGWQPATLRLLIQQ